MSLGSFRPQTYDAESLNVDNVIFSSSVRT